MLTGKIKIGKCFVEGIIDSGGAKALMPLKVALHNFKHLVEPITDMVELVQPDGTLMTGLTHKLTIPISEMKTVDGQNIDIKKENVTFMLGANVPFLSLSRKDIDNLDLWDSMKILSQAQGDIEPGLVFKLPMYANIPCYLSDRKWNALRKIHNDDDHGHGGEQRTYALSQKEYPTLNITRADVREFIKYCVACQKRSLAKFDIPHQPIENKLLNLMISDVW